MTTSHFLLPAIKGPEAFGLQVVGSRAWLATDARLAGTSASRRRGLLDVDDLPPGHALVIAPTQGIHTFGMRFPLDIVGVNRHGAVVSLKENVPRRRLVFSLRAFAIVELPTGAIRTSKLQRGDVLRVVRRASRAQREQTSTEGWTS